MRHAFGCHWSLLSHRSGRLVQQKSFISTALPNLQYVEKCLREERLQAQLTGLITKLDESLP